MYAADTSRLRRTATGRRFRRDGYGRNRTSPTLLRSPATDSYELDSICYILPANCIIYSGGDQVTLAWMEMVSVGLWKFLGYVQVIKVYNLEVSTIGTWEVLVC